MLITTHFMVLVMVVDWQVLTRHTNHYYHRSGQSVSLLSLYLTLLMAVDCWQLSSVLVVIFWGLFSLIEGAFLSANLTKVCTRGRRLGTILCLAASVTGGGACVFHSCWKTACTVV